MSKTTENYGLTKPEVGEFFSLETWNENMDKIDGELKKREDAQKESDNSLMNPKFTEAKERKNLTSGEKIHLMLGKISRFFSDMKAIAFSGSYNDLVDKPKIPTVLNNQTTTEEGYALDARQANPNIDGTLAKQISDLNGSLNILPIEVEKTSSKAVYNSYEFFRIGHIGHIGWYNMWLTYGSIQGTDKLEEVLFKFPEDISVRFITGGACSAYGETTHGGIDSIIYSTDHTICVRAAGAINQTFSIYATGIFLIN